MSISAYVTLTALAGLSLLLSRASKMPKPAFHPSFLHFAAHAARLLPFHNLSLSYRLDGLIGAGLLILWELSDKNL